MIFSRRAQWCLLLVVIGYANGGLIQNFISSFTGNIPSSETFSQRRSSEKEQELTGNFTASRRKEEGRGWSSGHEPSYHHQTHHSYYQHDQNMDLYGLLAGLSFASLLGATIIYLATRNNTGGRRRRSVGGDPETLAQVTEAIDDPFWENDDKVTPVRLY